ncbi:COG1683: Uncharacterized conserved protein / FIG143828: Hypothetical protein YbgA [hydrothermal vent metagenome]|uniref:Uncharacterized protein n=1 Tax=hydrothermal vent metagenome TaxID=652676 RepID=A0A3B0ZMM3_9ZZZZ
MTEKIKIAISSCLLGNAVRYDGLSKRNDSLIENLAGEFEMSAVCPEIMAGLGVPRPAVQLVKVGNEIRATGVIDTSLDVSSDIVSAAKEFVLASDGVCGLILKSRSPSCGAGSTPLYDYKNNVIGREWGLFARYVSQNNTGFPIVEDTLLGEAGKLKKFCQQVRDYSHKLNLN